MKMRAARVISREGVWDMLGWDEARKKQERDRLDAEAANDPVVNALMTGGGSAPIGGI
jgi:hypothetical protein